MIRPETLTADEVAPSGSLEGLLHVCLLRRLSHGSRGAANPDTARALRQVRAALRADRLDDALRNLDSAWRCRSEDAATLAPIYGLLLSLEARDHTAALHLLQRAIEFSPDPDVAALIVLALLRLQRPGEARTRIQAALAEYCVVPGDLLYQVAGEVMLQPGMEVPGWIARGPELELIGELAASEASNVLDIRVDGQPAFTQLLRPTPREGRRAFRFQSDQLRYTATLEISIRGLALLGSGARLPPDFVLDARVEGSGRRLRGWARVGWRPTRPPRLRIEDPSGHRRAVATARVAQPAWQWPFTLDLRALGLRGNRFHISAQLPDGRWQPLPDSPLLLEPAVRLTRSRPAALPGHWQRRGTPVRRSRALSQNQSRIDVVIAAYRGRDETLACIEAVLSTIDSMAQVVVVDDASDDPTLAAALDRLAADGRITLLRNAQNQGFVASVNRAIALHPRHDVVLLNSDTLVFDDWLARLRAAAYSGPAVGTVTPLSNSGSIASYPRAEGAAIDVEDSAALHALVASTHSGVRVAIPVGVGFCLYVRRDCLRAVGSFDVGVFGKGYGEEVDFCLRARDRGWSHQLAADVFVYHSGGVSFGGRRAALLERSHRLLNLRHPGFDGFIAGFLNADPLQTVRRRLDERRLAAFEGRFVLLVTLMLSGGVDRFVAERCRSLRVRGLFPLVLRPEQAGNTRRCELWTDAMELPNLRYDIPAQLPSLSALLSGLELEAIEIQHFLHLDARVIDAVRALPTPHDIFVHDYAWICPRVTLIDGSGRYCGEPAVSVCRACVRRNGSNLGETISVPALRARSAAWLAGARHVIAPTADTAARLQRHFPALKVQVQPHTESIVPAPLAAQRSADRRIRVALIGAIGEHKGYRILLACARDARTRRLPLEFVVIGYTENDAALLETGRVFITGRYTEAEAPHLLRREQPDVLWLPSVWPETWCYTLDHALSTGLPVAAFDLGAIAERLRTTHTGALMPLALSPRQINDRLRQLAEPAQAPTVNASRSRQTPLAHPGDDANIRPPQPSETAMPQTSDGKPAQDVQEEGMSASVQVLPLPAGLYLFSVRAASPAITRISGQLSLPAVHVGLGPGVRAEQVEFIEGPSTHGAWLFAHGDLLVTKINGAGATLIMTSVRAPGGEVLSIRVERLEARADALPGPSSTATGPSRTTGNAPAQKPHGKPSVRGSSKPLAGAGTDEPLPMHIQAHIRTRGDMSFSEIPWAGRVAPGLWIESFSVRPLKRFGAQDIEYKGLTGSGFETPWLSDEKMCGTRGMAVPLVGFAVRLKPGAAAAAYNCEYSGYFQSGVTVGPLRNGAPCRSTVANDPLEGIQVRVVRRPIVSPLAVSARDARPVRHVRSVPTTARSSSAVPARPGNGAAKRAAPAKRKPGAPTSVKNANRRARAHLTRGRGVRSTRRPSTRRP